MGTSLVAISCVVSARWTGGGWALGVREQVRGWWAGAEWRGAATNGGGAAAAAAHSTHGCLD